MLNTTINLWENESQPTLTTYVLDKIDEPGAVEKRPAVVICPGGGYEMLADREAEPVAIKFLSAGFNVFIVRYTVMPKSHTKPLLDLSKAMWLIRENAEKWKVDSEKIAVCGFSAGGHLAASLGVFYNKLFIRDSLNMPKGINEPNALILGYPVINAGKYRHEGSFINLFGEMPSQEQLDSVSLEEYVSEKTPPTFLWHTFNDDAVPMENSLLFAKSLREHDVPFELHIFPEGPHGLSLCNKETASNNPDLVNPHVANWVSLCIEWLEYIFTIKK